MAPRSEVEASEGMKARRGSTLQQPGKTGLRRTDLPDAQTPGAAANGGELHDPAGDGANHRWKNSMGGT